MWRYMELVYDAMSSGGQLGRFMGNGNEWRHEHDTTIRARDVKHYTIAGSVCRVR